MNELTERAKNYLAEHEDNYGKELVSALLEQLKQKDKELERLKGKIQFLVACV